MRRPRKRLPWLITGLVMAPSGEPNVSAIAEHLREFCGNDSIARLVADCLDPAVKEKPLGWRLDFKLGRGRRKDSHRIDRECLFIAAAYRQKVANRDGRTRKQIVGELAKEFGISDSRVGQHLAAANETERELGMKYGPVLSGQDLEAWLAEAERITK